MKSLRVRLLAVATLAALPLFGLYFHSAAQDRELAYRTAAAKVAHVTEMVAQQKQEFVLGVRKVLSTLVEAPAMEPTTAARCKERLAGIKGYQRHLSFIGIATPAGSLYCSAPPRPAPVDVSDRPYFRMATADCTPTLGQAQVGRVTGEHVIALAYPWCDKTRAVERVAIASMPLAWFEDIFSESPLPAGTEVSVVEPASGRVLLHYDGALAPPDAAVYGDPVDRDLLDRLVRNGRLDARRLLETADEVVIGVALDNRNQAELADIALLFRVPAGGIYGEYEHLAREQLGVLSLVTVLVLLAAWFGSTVTVVRPVRGMLRVMDRFAHGDGTARTGAPEDGAELAQLGHAFDRMADRVSTQQRDLIQANRLYAVLSRVNSAIVRLQDPDDLAAELTRALVDTGGFAAAFIYWREEQGFQLIASSYGDALAYTAADFWPVTTDATFDAIQVYNRHGAPAAEGSPWSGLEAAGGTAAAYIPIAPHQEVAAVLVVAALTDDAFGDKEVELLKEMSGDYAFALRLIDQQEHFQFLSYNDALTGLPNRHAFERRLRESAEATGIPDRRVVLALFKVDGFGRINSLFGRHTGDALMEYITGILREHRPPGIFLARVGDADFAALYEGEADRPAADELTGYIEAAFPGEVPVAGERIFVSVSIGLADASDGNAADADLMRCANAALEAAADQDSANSAQWFQPEMAATNSRRNRLEHALRRAVDHGDIGVHFQPQARLSDGQTCGVEVLARWHDPDLGNVSPGEFIPLAEEIGLMGPLGEGVLEQALARAAAWRDQGLDPGLVAVNLSPRQLHPRTARDLADLLGRYGHPPGALELELTETALTDDPGAMFQRVRELRELGVQTAIDDFGTGYSSLAYLKEFRFDKLKIDKSFVDHLTRHADDAAIARTIIAMGKALRMTVLAEGVETEDQLYYLKRHGCDHIQGYLYSRPLPAAEAEAFLREGRGLELETVDEGESSETVMLVDDEENLTRALRRSLRQEGYRVLSANSAAEAFAQLARHPTGVLVADHRLSDMQGSEFLSHVRELYPHSVRILLTGYTELEAVMDAVNRGAIFKFLTKPWEEEVLLQQVREAFAYHRRLNGGAAAMPAGAG